MVEHGYAENVKHAAHIAVEAGSDMDMQSFAYVEHLADLVRSDIVDEQLIEDAARRIFLILLCNFLCLPTYSYILPETQL